MFVLIVYSSIVITFLLLAQKKSNKRKGPALRFPRTSLNFLNSVGCDPPSLKIGSLHTGIAQRYCAPRLPNGWIICLEQFSGKPGTKTKPIISGAA